MANGRQQVSSMEAHGSKAAQQQSCKARQCNMTVASNMESGNMGGSNGSEAMAAAAGQRWQQAASAGASARSGAAPTEKRAGAVHGRPFTKRTPRQRSSFTDKETMLYDAATGDEADEAAASAPARRMESARARRRTGQ